MACLSVSLSQEMEMYGISEQNKKKQKTEWSRMVGLCVWVDKIMTGDF